LLSDGSLKEIVRSIFRLHAIPIVMKKMKWEETSQEIRTDEDETVNQASALWREPNGDQRSKYQEFYKHVAHDPERRLAWSTTASKPQEYVKLLYIPARAPSTVGPARAARLKLTCGACHHGRPDSCCPRICFSLRRGRFEHCAHISREILQESRDIEAIRGAHQARLGLLEDLPGTEGQVRWLWKEFGRVIKEGVERTCQRERIAKLCVSPPPTPTTKSKAVPAPITSRA